MRKIGTLVVIILFFASLLLSSCHIQEPPCPAYADIHQNEAENG
ncbi:MAG: hypothetical protein ACLFUW_02075 [Bacteroidales bacterium]